MMKRPSRSLLIQGALSKPGTVLFSDNYLGFSGDSAHRLAKSLGPRADFCVRELLCLLTNLVLVIQLAKTSLGGVGVGFHSLKCFWGVFAVVHSWASKKGIATIKLEDLLGPPEVNRRIDLTTLRCSLCSARPRICPSIAGEQQERHAQHDGRHVNRNVKCRI
jgi:hypothetical protein